MNADHFLYAKKSLTLQKHVIVDKPITTSFKKTLFLLKLAKRKNGRKKVVSCLNSYHGSTQGSLSAIGEDNMKKKYEPLIPFHKNIRFNNFQDLKILKDDVSSIIIEPVQGGTNFIIAQKKWLKADAIKAQ